MLGLDNPIHILFLLIILLLVFGAKRLPEMGKSLGEGLRGFKDSISGETPLSAMSSERPAAPADELAAAPVVPVSRPVDELSSVPAVPVAVARPDDGSLEAHRERHGSMSPAA
jgi:sec-independent protein translocase protein TatA